jgi:uncharacterized protein YceH (UPF0502 family)
VLDIEQELDEKPEVRELKAAQRRVLGVLLEKAFTTPEVYPMTLKALVAGCNQKSNRSPLVTYDGDRIEDIVEELRELGLLGVIHTHSGRTERYRHYMRKRYQFSEPQLAILTELLLRGRQTMGELRSRANRMVAIDDLGTLRPELQDLLDRGYVQASGSLERRGIEVDHAFYLSSESNSSLSMTGDSQPQTVSSSTRVENSSPPAAPSAVQSSDNEIVVDAIKRDIAELREENRELRSMLEEFQSEFEDFRRRLGDV